MVTLKCYMKKGRGTKIRIIDAQLSVVITVNTQYRHHQCNFMLLQNWSPREVILILTRVHEQRVVGIRCTFISFSTERQKKIRTRSRVLGRTRNWKTAKNIVKTEKSSKTENLLNMTIKSANS